MRYPEIITLNPGLIGPDNEITPDTVLAMPADATGLPTQHPPARGDTVEVQVQSGDTLWDIEQHVTGGARTGPPAGTQTKAGSNQADNGSPTPPTSNRAGH